MAGNEAPARTEGLRHQIDSGQTGDKVAFPDPAAAPLGADDEAAGAAPSAAQIAEARRLETRQTGEAVGLARGASMRESTGPASRSRLAFMLMGAGVALVSLAALALLIG
ncbi:hypothetical protein [Teichococcus rhizosphaerae]|uniref:hypothetical protein n=1 Tax=Teichococcus rhizosphaerae TaxID=1335062 RepID=UPI001145B7C9|nr:hypothetical protein [Pseudoroseomonas rhizosphaerae]